MSSTIKRFQAEHYWNLTLHERVLHCIWAICQHQSCDTVFFEEFDQLCDELEVEFGVQEAEALRKEKMVMMWAEHSCQYLALMEEDV